MKRRSFLFAVGACACMLLGLSTIGASQGRPRAQTTAAGERSIQIQPPAQSDAQVSAEAESRAQSVLPDKGILFLEAAVEANETRSPQGGGNDDCTTPQMIGDGPTEYSTIGNTTDGLAHQACMFDGQTYHDDWFTYIATCTGDLTISTCNNAAYDTDLVIYTGYHPVDWTCPPRDGPMLGCNDDGLDCNNYSSEVTVQVTTGQWLTIRVGGWNDGDMGTATVTLTCDGGCGDGICIPSEDCCTCPADCSPCCGDATCLPCEDCYECPEDCGECVCPAPLVYDNGHWTGVNGGRPTAGWSLAGCIDDFVVPGSDFGGTSFSCVQVEFAVDTHPPTTAWNLRIYDLNDVDGQGGGDGTIAGLGDFNLAVPKCFLTYSLSDGSLIISDAHDCGFLRCIYDIDGVGEVCDLDPGHYGFHIMFADAGDDGFWLTAPQDESECLAVWGPAVPFPADFCQGVGPAFHNMHFNMRGFQPCEQCPFDVDDDGQVGAFDLANLLGAWGECAGDACLCVDANADGQVDAFDLANLLGSWGPCQ